MDRISDEERFGIPQRHSGENLPKASMPYPQDSDNKPGSNTTGMKTQLVEGGGNNEEDDLEDPQEKLRAACREQNDCTNFFQVFEECNARVNSREKTNETCEQELYDFVGCVDGCVAKDLFKFLK